MGHIVNNVELKFTLRLFHLVLIVNRNIGWTLAGVSTFLAKSNILPKYSKLFKRAQRKIDFKDDV